MKSTVRMFALGIALLAASAVSVSAQPKINDAQIAAIAVAEKSWRRAGPEAWVGVCLEILSRINKRSFEIAHAIMHTTGQAFVMSFQAELGGLRIAPASPVRVSDLPMVTASA